MQIFSGLVALSMASAAFAVSDSGTTVSYPFELCWVGYI